MSSYSAIELFLSLAPTNQRSEWMWEHCQGRVIQVPMPERRLFDAGRGSKDVKIASNGHELAEMSDKSSDRVISFRWKSKVVKPFT
jgi:hypothetical protein